MVTYYNTKDLVSFGLYLLSDERKANFEASEIHKRENGQNPIPAHESLKLVHDADLANWRETRKKT